MSTEPTQRGHFERRDADHRCPSCGRTGVICVATEGRTGSRCCGDCDAQPVQRPVHVWPPATASEVTE